MLAKMEHVVPRHAGGRRGDRRRLNALLSFKAATFHFIFGPFNFKIQPFNLTL